MGRAKIAAARAKAKADYSQIALMASNAIDTELKPAANQLALALRNAANESTCETNDAVAIALGVLALKVHSLMAIERALSDIHVTLDH